MSGSHAGPLFETYTFLVLDLDHNTAWLRAQQHFRAKVLRSKPRMAYKGLNDKVRRQALGPFLRMSGLLRGWLVTFAISKNGLSFFQTRDRTKDVEDLLARWKTPVQERLLRVLHLGGFLVSGLSRPRQDLFFVTDEDDIAANVPQLTDLTKLFGIVASNSLSHDLGHIRCGTAKSDDGTLWLEDLLAYADFATGAVAEIITAMAGGHGLLQRDIVAPLPSGLSHKARAMASWLSDNGEDLHPMTCVIDLGTSPKMRARLLHWHTMPGLIEVR
jgi:hypothetical protein